MARIRLTKEFSFESAHALEGYDGKCRHIHGHSYRLYVTIIGEPISDSVNPKYGMVMDFGDLKNIVNEEIILDIEKGHPFGCPSVGITWFRGLGKLSSCR